MRRAALIAAAALSVLCTGAASRFPLTSYITNDQSWRPPESVVAGAQRTFDAYYAAIDRGDYAGAYALRSQKVRVDQTEADFVQQMSGVYGRAGRTRERMVTVVTYIRELPEGLPEPGLYVTFDFRSRHENVFRACGFAAVHVWPDGRMDVPSESLGLMGKENTDAYRRQGGQQAVERAWLDIEKNRCPGEADLRRLGYGVEGS